MDRFLKFSDFTTKKKYCKLQERFCLYDERGDYDKIAEPFEDRTITFLKIDLDGKEDYEEVSFKENYLKENIPKMSSSYFRRFLNTIKDKALYLEEQRSELAKIYIKEIYKTSEILNEVDYVQPEIIVLLLEQLELLQTEIYDYLKDPYPEIETKIKFNWSRTEIIYFFHLLKNNKYIEEISNSNLGRMIDRVMEYSDGTTYKPINDSRKHLSDFKVTSGRSESRVNETLKGYFSEDFFNV